MKQGRQSKNIEDRRGEPAPYDKSLPAYIYDDLKQRVTEAVYWRIPRDLGIGQRAVDEKQAQHIDEAAKRVEGRANPNRSGIYDNQPPWSELPKPDMPRDPKLDSPDVNYDPKVQRPQAQNPASGPMLLPMMDTRTPHERAKESISMMADPSVWGG